MNRVTTVGASAYKHTDTVTLHHAHPTHPRRRIITQPYFVIVETIFGHRANSVALLADAGVSAGVVVAGIAISLAGAYWLDPLISLGIALIIIVGT